MYQAVRHLDCTAFRMFTDRDFYRSVLAGALENFGVNTLAVILNVSALEVTRWAQGRTRPPAPLLLQVIDLMWPKEIDAPRLRREGESRRVLVAVSPQAHAALARILVNCPVQIVGSFQDGVSALQHEQYSDVIIGYLFGESRMFEFARQVRELQPAARVLCVKAGGRALGSDVRFGLHEAAMQLGCEGFFDLTAGGVPEGFNRAFEEVVGRFLPPDSPARERASGVMSDLRTTMLELRALV